MQYKHNLIWQGYNVNSGKNNIASFELKKVPFISIIALEQNRSKIKKKTLLLIAKMFNFEFSSVAFKECYIY